MKLTIDDEQLERALRDRAAAQNKSVEAVVFEILSQVLCVMVNPAKRGDLSDIAGQDLITPEIEAALEDQRRMDWEMWQ